MTHEEICERIFEHSCRCLGMKGFRFQPKTVRKGDGYAKSYTLGYTDLNSKLVVIDIYTQKLKKPKKYSSILAVIAHELAHHQKRPYREYQRAKKRWINRIHYPDFYKQVNKNIDKFKKDKVLRQFYG